MCYRPYPVFRIPLLRGGVYSWMMDKGDKKQEESWSWETDILAQYPSGVDWSQIEERLKLTPTERLERMRQFLVFLEGAKRGRGH